MFIPEENLELLFNINGYRYSLYRVNKNGLRYRMYLGNDVKDLEDSINHFKKVKIEEATEAIVAYSKQAENLIKMAKGGYNEI